MNCRYCNTALKHTFVDLYNSPPSNSYLRAEQLDEPEAYYPLKVFVCDKCYLVQVNEYKKATEIFDKDYAYFSSYSTSWLKHCQNYAAQVSERFKLNDKSLVIEIASNDGYLLQYFAEKKIPVLGVEPTQSTADVAIKKGINTVVDFFGVKLAERLKAESRTADLIIGNNVLAHVPNLNDFVGGLKNILNPRGVVTMEFPHLLQLIQNNQFDTIYHEHFSYLSLHTVVEVFNHHGLDIFDVDEIPTHGGSLRIYAQHQQKPYEKSGNVALVIKKEKDFGLTDIKGYAGFQNQALSIKNEFLSFLLQQKAAGKKVAAYGAAAKGNTLLNYCGIKSDLIDYVVDASPYKQTKYLPGSHIPIVKEEMLTQTKPDFIVIFAWNIKDEIVAQLRYTKEWGAKFVIAIPRLTIID